jgi:hypothetical protein
MLRALGLLSLASAIVTTIGSATAVAQVPAAVQPSRAGDFVDSVGVNTHFNYPGTPYTDRFPTVAAALLRSGIKHIRDGGLRYSRQRVMTYLGQLGIKHSLGFPAEVTAADIRTGLRENSPYVDYVEPQNELDLSKNHPNWAQDWRNEQQLLFTTVRADPANASIVVVGPALGHFRDASVLGPIDEFEDVGAMHHYPCSVNPGDMQAKVGFANVMTEVRRVHVTKPVWTTEIGYEDDLPGGRCALADTVIAKYDTRTLTERWLAGQPRTYFYQFADMPKLTGYDAMGFVRLDGTPKPQYTAMQSLLLLLADSDRTFQPSPLSMSLSGATSNVHQLLLQKGDGRYLLLLWLEVPGWDATAQAPVNVPTQRVVVNLASLPRGVIDYVYSPNWTYRQNVLHPSTAIEVPVNDAISVLELRP